MIPSWQARTARSFSLLAIIVACAAPWACSTTPVAVVHKSEPCPCSPLFPSGVVVPGGTVTGNGVATTVPTFGGAATTTTAHPSTAAVTASPTPAATSAAVLASPTPTTTSTATPVPSPSVFGFGPGVGPSPPPDTTAQYFTSPSPFQTFTGS